MTVQRAQTITLYLLVLSALGTVFTADAFEWPVVVGIFTATCASLFIPHDLRARWAKSRLLVLALLGLLGAVALDVWLGHRDLVSGATLFLLLVLVSRLYTPRSSNDAIQVLTLSFVVVLAGSALNTSFSFAPYFVLVIVCSIWALITTHLQKTAEARPEQARALRISRRFWLSTSALAIVIFLQTTLFFVVFPRMGLGYFKPKLRASASATGFTDRVSLGQAGVLQGDETVVARIEFPRGTGGIDPERLYFRGATLSLFDGQQWSKTPEKAQLARFRADGTFETRAAERDPTLYFVYYQEPTEADYAFLPEATPVARLLQDNPLWSGRPRVRFYTDSSGDVSLLRPLGLAVQLEGWLLPDAPLAGEPKLETLALPSLDPRIAAAALEWRGDAATPEAIATRLGAALRSGFDYSNTMVAPPDGESPLGHFLFERKAGHCEYFASALAVMLRQSGVHARIVTGYRGASFNRYGGYFVVQEYRAHSWVEYWVPSRGWLRADPTPSAELRDTSGLIERAAAFADLLRYRWNRYVIEYDLDLQLDALRSLRRSLDSSGSSGRGEAWSVALWPKLVLAGLLFIVVVLALVTALGGSARRRPDAEATRLLSRLERTLVRRGFPRRRPSETPARWVAVVAEREAGLGGILLRFSDAYLRARFSPPASERDLEEMRTLLHDVERKVG